MEEQFQPIVFNTQQIGDKHYALGTFALLTDDVSSLRPGFIYRVKSSGKIILQMKRKAVDEGIYESVHPIFYSETELVKPSLLTYDLQFNGLLHPTEEAIEGKREYFRRVLVLWTQVPKSVITDIVNDNLKEGDQRLILCENDYCSVPENMGSLWGAYVDTKIALTSDGVVTVRPVQTLKSRALDYAMNTNEVRAEEHFINGYQQCLEDMKNK